MTSPPEPVPGLTFPRRPGRQYLCHFGMVWEWTEARCARIGSFPPADELQFQHFLDGDGRLLRAERIGGPPPAAWRMEIARDLGMRWLGFDTESLEGASALAEILFSTLTLVEGVAELSLAIERRPDWFEIQLRIGGHDPVLLMHPATSDYVHVESLVAALNRAVEATGLGGRFAWNGLVDDQGAYVVHGTPAQLRAARERGLKLEPDQ